MTDRILDGGIPACSAAWIIVVKRGSVLWSSRVAAAAWVSAIPARTVSSAQY
jgi:hypothetical protein